MCVAGRLTPGIQHRVVLSKSTDVSGEHIALVFCAEKEAKQERSVKSDGKCFNADFFFDPEDGGHIFFRDVG
jgi:hypothetical protein